jgi:phosphotriesterase-related protein
MTVLGPVPADKLGVALPHEHVTTDFLGAERLPQPRYERDLAVATILPHLKALKDRGASILFECTPNYIGRDVVLLKRLSQESGLSIVTNTGYYGAVGNKFLPRHAHEESAAQLAARWRQEWHDGIDGTGIRPGFIKLGVEKGKLPPLHEKLVRAAARVHRESGLAICIHTGDGEAALEELRILREEGIAPEAFVWVHAQNDPGPVQWDVAGQGGWVSLDGYNLGRGNPERYVEMLLALKGRKLLHRVLISHDDGWSVDGEEPTGAGLTLFGNRNPRPYESIFTKLVPDLQAAGFDKSEMHLLTVTNPAAAFALRPRLA